MVNRKLAEPSDLSLDWPMTLSNIFGLLILASFFIFALPWWRPMAWFAIYAVVMIWRLLYLRHTEAQNTARLKYARRLVHWVCGACAGSTAYWLFVPNNPTMHVMLALTLVCMTCFMTLETVGDPLRPAVSLCLILIPSAIRFVFQEDPATVMMGIGGILTIPSIWLLWKRQQGVWEEQYLLRQRAELAAQALAETTLARARFFAAANHDLRQPVHALGLYVSTLETQRLDTADQSAIDGMRRAWNALSDLLAQLLDISRAEAGALQPKLKALHLADALAEQIAHYSPAATAHGQRLIALGGQDLYVYADPLMLARVLGNLVDNAIKFSPRGAAIVLAARRGDAHDARIQVRDCGPGIPSADQARVFDDFVQIGNPQRDRQAGFGLGLAIARRFVEAMGGALTLRSTPGRGCVMQVRIPLSNAAPAASARQPTPSHSPVLALPAMDWPSLGITRLLVLEDDALVARAMQSLAQAWTLPCQVVGDGTAALSAAQAGDVVLCDIRLPQGPSGLEVATTLQARGIAVVLITGEADPELRAQAKALQLTLLIKPVTATALHTLLLHLAKSQNATALQPQTR